MAGNSRELALRHFANSWIAFPRRLGPYLRVRRNPPPVAGDAPPRVPHPSPPRNAPPRVRKPTAKPDSNAKPPKASATRASTFRKPFWRVYPPMPKTPPAPAKTFWKQPWTNTSRLRDFSRSQPGEVLFQKLGLRRFTQALFSMLQELPRPR